MYSAGVFEVLLLSLFSLSCLIFFFTTGLDYLQSAFSLKTASAIANHDASGLRRRLSRLRPPAWVLRAVTFLQKKIRDCAQFTEQD